MRILIVGVGAIGSTFLAFLSRAGYKVQGLLRENSARIESIEVEGIWGSFSVEVDTTPDLEEVTSPDLIILSVKSYDTESALKRIEPLVSDTSYILIAQNGYGNYERAVEIYGEDRVLLSRIIFGARRESRSRVRITVSADDVIVGNPSPAVPDSVAQQVANILKTSGIPARYEREVYKFLWDKILYNCALNPLGALLEVNYGYLASNPHTRAIMDRVIEEIFEVSSSKGIQSFWKSAREYINHFYDRLIPPTEAHFPSMLEDIKKGKTEIDSLNGAILKLGREAGIATPTNEMITMLVKAKEELYSSGE